MVVSSALMKARMLSHGLRIERDTLVYLASHFRYKCESFVYNDSHFRLGPSAGMCPQELILRTADGSHQTVVSCIVCPESSLSLVVDDDHLLIHDESDDGPHLEVQVDLLPRPDFWYETSPNGVRLGRILNTCGLCEANVWLWHNCALPYLGEACRFCGINAVASSSAGDDLLSARTLSNAHSANDLWQTNRERVIGDLIYALRRATETYDPYKDHMHLIFISGNLANDMLNLQWQIYVEAMEALGRAGMPLHGMDSTAILMPPLDLAWIQRAREAGLGVIGFNLEVWDPKLFAAYCPGKALFGRQRMIDALQRAVSIYGVGSVWSNFVLGLEPIDSLLDGMEQLAFMGIVPGANVFHKDRGAQLHHLPVPETEDIIDFYTRLANLYHHYGFRPYYCENALRTSLANEAFRGWLK